MGIVLRVMRAMRDNADSAATMMTGVSSTLSFNQFNLIRVNYSELVRDLVRFQHMVIRI
jgi:hypothetical protein